MKIAMRKSLFLVLAVVILLSVSFVIPESSVEREPSIRSIQYEGHTY